LPSLKTNIVANYVGKAVAALTAFLFVPVYIRYLGIEAYGLIGFFTLLQTLAGVFDFGFSPTLNRELARFSAKPGTEQEARDLVRTLELIYWGIGIAIGVAVVAASPLIAHRWIHPRNLAPAVVQQSLLLMGLMLALQWPFSFYEGGLLGLQKLVTYNAVQSAIQIVRGLGALAVLHFVAPTIVAFFWWQVAISAAGAIASATLLWNALPPGGRPRFSPRLLRSIWRFAADVTGISVLAIVLTIADKLVLSKRLPLADFGYYSLAFVVASTLYYAIYPLTTAIFPRLSQFVAMGDGAAVVRTYHAGCQLMTVITAPVALVLSLFSFEIIRIWTGDPIVARNTAPIAAIATIGTLLNGFMNIPYTLQLAYGWTRLGLVVNAAAVAVQIPLLLFATSRWGAMGAVSVWLALNVMSCTIAINLMYRKLLSRERWHWYLHDIGAPLAAALAVVGAARLATPELPRIATVIALGFITSAAFAAAAFAAPQGRSALLSLRTSFMARLARS
jgi:O-antigen/teichoic acid export membrane protein